MSNKNKSKTMWVRMTPRMDKYIRKAAGEQEMEIAEVIRRAIMEYMLAHPLEEEKR